MKRNIIYYIKTCFAIFLFLPALQSYAGNAKLYLATNKDTYSPSESVHFQVFLLNAPNTNKTVYVELLDCKGNMLAKKMLPLTSSISWGNLKIPQTDEAAFYILYCYVISKDSVEVDCNKKIFIKHNNTTENIETGKESIIDFFTEGGSFVADLPNNVLICTKDENDNPISTEGKIIDENNTILARFFTNEMGVARVNINPELSVKNFIVADNKKGGEVKQELPIASEYGVSLSITTNNDSLTYYVYSYAEDEKQIDYNLEVISDNETVYRSAINFRPGISYVKEKLSLNILPTGFLTFRLTDKTNRFYAKRIVYNNYDPVNTSILKIVDTINNKTAKVVIPEYVNGTGYLNILIKDKAEIKTTGNAAGNPAVKNTSAEGFTFNDFLISCSEIPVKNFTKRVNNDSLLTLSGIAYSSENKILQYRQINFVFHYKNLKKDYLVATTDYYGKFEIKGLNFYDSAVVYYQLADKSAEKNDIRIEMKVTPAQSFTPKQIMLGDLFCETKTGDADTVAKKNNQNIILSNPDKKAKTLSEVNVRTEKPKEKTDSEKYREKNVSGQHDQAFFKRNEIDLIANPQVIDNTLLLDFLKGRIASIQISVNSAGQILMMESGGDGIGLYLDDMDISTDASLLANLMIRDIALIRYYGLPLKPRTTRTRTRFDDPNKPDDALNVIGGGDLMIYTKRSFNPSAPNVKGLVKTHIVGYDRADPITFHDPQLFYWKPNWTKQKEQTIYIGLPANNTEKSTQLIIEGINPAQALYTFKQNLVFK